MNYKPRPVTIPLAFLAAYFFVILNTIGFPGAATSGSLIWSGNMFGWPSEYLVTDFSERQLEQLHLWRRNMDNGFVEPGTITLSPDSVQEYSPRLLVINVAVCLIMVVVGAFVAEYWQRFFGRPRQIGLRSLFVLVLLAAVIVYLSRTAYAMSGYYFVWPLFEPIAVGVLVVSLLVTIVFDVHMGTHPLKRGCHNRRMRGAR